MYIDQIRSMVDTQIVQIMILVKFTHISEFTLARC